MTTPIGQFQRMARPGVSVNQEALAKNRELERKQIGQELKSTLQQLEKFRSSDNAARNREAILYRGINWPGMVAPGEFSPNTNLEPVSDLDIQEFERLISENEARRLKKSGPPKKKRPHVNDPGPTYPNVYDYAGDALIPESLIPGKHYPTYDAKDAAQRLFEDSVLGRSPRPRVGGPAIGRFPLYNTDAPSPGVGDGDYLPSPSNLVVSPEVKPLGPIAEFPRFKESEWRSGQRYQLPINTDAEVSQSRYQLPVDFSPLGAPVVPAAPAAAPAAVPAAAPAVPSDPVAPEGGVGSSNSDFKDAYYAQKEQIRKEQERKFYEEEAQRLSDLLSDEDRRILEQTTGRAGRNNAEMSQAEHAQYLADRRSRMMGQLGLTSRGVPSPLAGQPLLGPPVEEPSYELPDMTYPAPGPGLDPLTIPEGTSNKRRAELAEEYLQQRRQSRPEMTDESRQMYADAATAARQRVRDRREADRQRAGRIRATQPSLSDRYISMRNQMLEPQMMSANMRNLAPVYAAQIAANSRMQQSLADSRNSQMQNDLTRSGQDLERQRLNIQLAKFLAESELANKVTDPAYKQQDQDLDLRSEILGRLMQQYMELPTEEREEFLNGQGAILRPILEKHFTVR